jgi:methyltransferase (TIGR00027 family)
MNRTEDDSWDLASSVGATATAAAAGRALASRGSDPLISDRFAEPLVKAVGVDFYTRIATGELDPDEVDDDRDATFGIGRMRDMMALRTRYFDKFLAEADKAGLRQVVILAAGLDCRAYRLQWPAGTALFEIDQPQVIAFKTQTLAQLGAHPTVEHRAVGVDLRDDWSSALQQAGFDPTRPTAWIAEGLLPFLSPYAQDELLNVVSELSAVGSRLAIEDIPTNMAQIGERLAAVTGQWRTHGLDNPWAELWYTGERGDVDEYLNARGWCTVRTKAAELFVANGLSSESNRDDQAAILNSLAYVEALRG